MICTFKAIHHLFVFEKLLNKSLEIYEIDPTNFLFAPGLVWQVSLKKIKAKLELLSKIVIHDKKEYQKWNMSNYSSVHKSY